MGYHPPTGFQRLEVVRVQGVGKITRQLSADGYFNPKQPLTVSLQAEALFGSIKPHIEEYLPTGLTVTNISDGGKFADNIVSWDLESFSASKSLRYTITPPDHEIPHH